MGGEAWKGEGHSEVGHSCEGWGGVGWGLSVPLTFGGACRAALGNNIGKEAVGHNRPLATYPSLAALLRSALESCLARGQSFHGSEGTIL